MKKSGKIGLTTAAVAAALLFALGLSACGSSERSESPTETRSLYAQGLEIVRLMSEMTQSEEYIDIFTGSGEIKSVIQTISVGDYTTPKAVYAISVPDESLAAMAGLHHLDDASEGLQTFLTQKILGSLTTQINAMGGVEKLAASSVCTVGKTFANADTNENVIYLYTYENAAPIAVTFTAGEDQTVSAGGVFVLYDGFSCDSADEIKTFFRDRISTAEVTEVLPE